MIELTPESFKTIGLRNGFLLKLDRVNVSLGANGLKFPGSFLSVANKVSQLISFLEIVLALEKASRLDPLLLSLQVSRISGLQSKEIGEKHKTRPFSGYSFAETKNTAQNIVKVLMFYTF